MTDLGAPVRRGSLTRERYREPDVTDRPGFRWWWHEAVEPTELVRELHAIADAGLSRYQAGTASRISSRPISMPIVAGRRQNGTSRCALPDHGGALSGA